MGSAALGNAPDVEMVTELARAVVKDVAPRELMIFPAASAAFFKNPTAVTRHRNSGAALGFGVDLGILMTPVVLTVLTEVLKFLWSEVADIARDAGREAVKERVKRFFKGSGADPTETLSPTQRAKVRARALEAAAALLPAAQAALIADAIDARLA